MNIETGNSKTIGFHRHMSCIRIPSEKKVEGLLINHCRLRKYLQRIGVHNVFPDHLANDIQQLITENTNSYPAGR